MRRRARRALTADQQNLTPEDRKAIQQSRVNFQSGRYLREVAIEKSWAAARPQEPKK